MGVVVAGCERSCLDEVEHVCPAFIPSAEGGISRGGKQMTSWVGRCDAISVNRRFIHKRDREPDWEWSDQRSPWGRHR